jgi:hypothetical protein
MMHKAGFAGVIAAGFFSVFLLVWHGYNGYVTDWVYGFLAVFWSLIMMLRLMTLTEPLQTPEATGYLAQKLLRNLREKQEQTRNLLLETSFGGSFVLFIGAGILFAAWQVYCAAFPADGAAQEGLYSLMSGLFGQIAGTAINPAISLASPRFFDWGQGFLLFLAFCMMAFVLRSYAAEKPMVRPTLIVLCGYAIAGLFVCAGLGHGAEEFTVDQAALVGNGAGSISYLLSTLPADRSLTLFDILLLESGVVGLGLLTFLVFVPLGYIALSAGQGRTDALVLCCGLMTGMALILSVFLTFTPVLAGFMLLCAMGLFLAWGASETALQGISLTPAQ